jgi:AAA domain
LTTLNSRAPCSFRQARESRCDKTWTRLVEEMRSAIPAAFESEDYWTRKQVIEKEVKEHHEKTFEELRREAQEKGIALVRTPAGLVFAPTQRGEVMSPEDFQKLPEAERQRVETKVMTLSGSTRCAPHQPEAKYHLAAEFVRQTGGGYRGVSRAEGMNRLPSSRRSARECRKTLPG